MLSGGHRGGQRGQSLRRGHRQQPAARIHNAVYGLQQPKRGSFTSTACNFDTGGTFSSPPTAIDLCDPSGVALDGTGNLYVSDYNNHRVLEYNTPLNPGSGESGAGDATADTVFGQGGSFTSKTCNSGGATAGSICVPTGLTVDGSGNLYVTDGFNNRVLEYNTPLTTDTLADRVFGTCGPFKFACSGISANSLNDPTGVAVDKAGRLYVADNQNNRVIAYDHPFASPTPTATASATATQMVTPTPTATATATPTATATRAVGNPNRDPVAGSRTYLGQPEKLGLERRSGRDRVTQYHDQQHWHRNSDRQCHLAEAQPDPDGARRRKRNPDRSRWNPQRDNRILAREERIDQRYDPDHEQ